MPCRGVPGKTLGRPAPGLIPGPRDCETMSSDHRTETRMTRAGPTHETRPRPLSFRNGGPLPPYERSRDLPRLVPIWPGELDNMTPETHHRLLQRLRRALRDERRRGIAGSWTYDLGRHARLYRALHAEIALMWPPLSTWVAGARDTSQAHHTLVPEGSLDQTPARRPSPLNPGACPSPSSLRVASEPRRNSAPPWDSRGAAATWPGTPRATAYNVCADDASTT
jgi:hypothetical protein